MKKPQHKQDEEKNLWDMHQKMDSLSVMEWKSHKPTQQTYRQQQKEEEEKRLKEMKDEQRRRSKQSFPG